MAPTYGDSGANSLPFTNPSSTLSLDKIIDADNMTRYEQLLGPLPPNYPDPGPLAGNLQIAPGLPMAYIGQNMYLEQVMMQMTAFIGADLQELAPAVITDQLSIIWSQVKFGPDFASSVPHGSLPRLLGFEERQGQAGLVRNGIGARLEFDFAHSPKGRRIFLESLQAMGNAVSNSIIFEIILGIRRVGIDPDVHVPPPTRSFAQKVPVRKLLENGIDEWYQFLKSRGVPMLTDECARHFARIGARKPDSIIMPHQVATYLNLVDPERTSYAGAGREGYARVEKNEPIKTFHGLKVYVVDMHYDLAQEHNPMTTRSIIGEYYLPRTYIGSDYTTESTSIQIYNEDDDCMHIVRMETLLDNSHVFNAAGDVDTTHFKVDDEKRPFLINSDGYAKQYVGELDDTELPEATYRAIVKAIVAAAKENVGGGNVDKMKKWIADVLEFISGGSAGAAGAGAAASGGDGDEDAGGAGVSGDPWEDILKKRVQMLDYLAEMAGIVSADAQVLYDALRDGLEEDVNKWALEAIADMERKVAFPTADKPRDAYIKNLNTGLKAVKPGSNKSPSGPPSQILKDLFSRFTAAEVSSDMYKSLQTIPELGNISSAAEKRVWKDRKGFLQTFYFNDGLQKAIRTAYVNALGARSAKRGADPSATVEATLTAANAASNEEGFITFMNAVTRWLKKRYGIKPEDTPKDLATYTTDFSGIDTAKARRVAAAIDAYMDLVNWPANQRYTRVFEQPDTTVEEFAYKAYYCAHLDKASLKRMLHNDIPLPFTFALVRPNCRYETLGVTVMARGEQTCFMARRPGNFTLSHDHSAGYINATYNAYFGLVIPRKEDIRNSLFDFPSGYHGGRGVKFYAEKDHFDSHTTSSMLAVPMTYPEAQHLFGKPFDLRGKFVLEHNSVSENDIAENENLHYSYGHWVKRKWSIPDGKSSSDNYVATNTILFMGTYQQYNSANQNFSDEVRGNGHMASLAAPGARSITSGNVTVDDMHRLGLMSAKRMAH